MEHTDKTRIPHVPVILLDLARTGDAAYIQRHAVLDDVGEFAFGEDVADGHASARFQDPERLVENELFVFFGDEVDDAIADDAVRRAGKEVYGRDAGVDEGDVVVVELCGDLVGATEHVLSQQSANLHLHLT